MKHLLVSREFPPSEYPAGGIGTYIRNIATALVRSGDEVHVIGQRWVGAPTRVERRIDGRLTIHRIAAEDSELDYPDADSDQKVGRNLDHLSALGGAAYWFSWRAGRLAEILIEQENIDILEAQEWEAPLYFFMLRRSLGLGPQRLPPVITHLHSPTEVIVKHNNFPLDHPSYLPLARMEEFVIRHADARLCPSSSLARDAEKRYCLDTGSITVVPLPVHGFPHLNRSEEIWSNGRVCYVGRLETRKGVLDWIEAAVQVSPEFSHIEFDLIGADLPSELGGTVKSQAERIIPPALRPRFHFHGSRPHAEILQFLAKAQVAVVPSRWENFPNVCIEAMSSGLPVLATRAGGMVDLIEDEITGWLAPTTPPRSAGLAQALRRALDTEPAKKAQMGEAAAARVRRICSEDAIVHQHQSMRRSLLTTGPLEPQSSQLLPPIISSNSAGMMGRVCTSNLKDAPVLPLVFRETPRAQNFAVIAIGSEGECAASLSSLTVQTRQPAWSAIVPDDATHELARVVAAAQKQQVEVLIFLRGGSELYPDALATLVRVFEVRPALGFMTSWHACEAGEGPQIAPPGLPYLLCRHELACVWAARVTAYDSVPGLEDNHGVIAELWNRSLGIVVGGWSAACYPGVLASVAVPMPRLTSTSAKSMVLERYQGWLRSYALDAILLLQSGVFTPSLAAAGRAQVSRQSLTTPANSNRSMRSRVLKGIRQPRKALKWLGRKLLRADVGLTVKSWFA